MQQGSNREVFLLGGKDYKKGEGEAGHRPLGTGAARERKGGRDGEEKEKEREG